MCTYDDLACSTSPPCSTVCLSVCHCRALLWRSLYCTRLPICYVTHLRNLAFVRRIGISRFLIVLAYDTLRIHHYSSTVLWNALSMRFRACEFLEFFIATRTPLRQRLQLAIRVFYSYNAPYDIRCPTCLSVLVNRVRGSVGLDTSRFRTS